MNRLFTSTGYLESEHHAASLPMQDLPPFLRVLLTTDGTVTKSLEAYFWEPVAVQNCGQRYVHLEADAPVIDRKTGEEVLQRKVQLVGKNSSRCYATAVSLLCTELLPEKLRLQLEQGEVGVGELLRECGLETYREIVEIGRGSPSDSCTEDSVWRTYRIVMAHQAFIQITEFFPVSLYRHS